MTRLNENAQRAVETFFRIEHAASCSFLAGPGKPYYYESNAGEIWAPFTWEGHTTQVRRVGMHGHCDRILRALFQSAKGRPAFHRQFAVYGARGSGYVIIPRANGVVIIDDKGGCVWKVLSAHGAIGNEVLAMRALEGCGLSHYAPRLLDHGRYPSGAYSFIKTEFLPGARHIPAKQRLRTLREKLTPMLFEMYRRIGIEEVSAADYLAGLWQRCVAAEFENDLTWCFDLALRLSRACSHDRVFLGRVHGDVGNSNAMIAGNRILLIDWALSCHANIFAELFRQEHRNLRITSRFWDNLLDSTTIPEELAGGWAPTFCAAMHDLTGHHFGPREVAFNLLSSLIERVLFDRRVKGRDVTSRSASTTARLSHGFVAYLRVRYDPQAVHDHASPPKRDFPAVRT